MLICKSYKEFRYLLFCLLLKLIINIYVLRAPSIFPSYVTNMLRVKLAIPLVLVLNKLRVYKCAYLNPSTFKCYVPKAALFFGCKKIAPILVSTYRVIM